MQTRVRNTSDGLFFDLQGLLGVSGAGFIFADDGPAIAVSAMMAFARAALFAFR